ncbi:MAG: hypothetical protein HYT80_08855 [Euryarchaeota archaeon]|nr:hypothetical protein [Euryarchaeota archaeon]
MNVREVRELAQNGRAIKASNYHAGRRGISFLQVLTALEKCYQVEKDHRSDAKGSLLHPDGWFAIANLPTRIRLRIDFDVVQDDMGNLLLVVTAYDV